MILGKEETYGTRPFLYHQKSSFFSVKDREATLGENNDSSEPVATGKMASDLAEGSPHYVAPTTSSLARSKSVISTSCLSPHGPGWSRAISQQQMHVNQLKKRQREQLQPFFLAKSKFLAREPSKAEIRREKMLSVNRANMQEDKKEQRAVDKVTKVKFTEAAAAATAEPDKAGGEKSAQPEEAPEPVELTADELELIRESQGKCSDWLERHVFKQQRVSVLKLKQFNF